LGRLDEVDGKTDPNPHHALDRTAIDDRLKFGHALDAALPDKPAKSQVRVVPGHEHLPNKPERSMRLLRRFFIAWVVALVRVYADTEPVAVDVVDPGAALEVGLASRHPVVAHVVERDVDDRNSEAVAVLVSRPLPRVGPLLEDPQLPKARVQVRLFCKPLLIRAFDRKDRSNLVQDDLKPSRLIDTNQLLDVRGHVPMSR